MGKALPALVIVLLVLGIVALILGSVLFSQREVLKGRTLIHEEAAVKVAQNLHMEGINPDQLVQQMKDYKTMRTPLDLIAVAAQNQYETLQHTKEDLAATKQELATTKSELEGTKAELAAAQQKIVELTDTIDRKNAELLEANGRIVQLEQDKTTLQYQIEDLNNQLVKAEEETRDCQDEVVTLKKVIADMEAKEGLPAAARIPVGTTGHILVVNPDWNFVVLDIGSDQGLVPNAEMLVHRKDQLIGKVRISSVEKNLAIAEILRDWLREPIREGDYVLY